MIGSALALPIRLYAQIVHQLARSFYPQMSIHESFNKPNPIFDLPIDPRVAYNDPGYIAVLTALQENAKRIGNKISQMGNEIKRTGKNISSVGYNLLEFSKKATETLYKTPLIPQSYDEVPISLEPSPDNEFSKLINSVPSEKPALETVTLTPEVSSLVDEIVVVQKKSENQEEQIESLVEPIVEVVTSTLFSEASKPVLAPVQLAPSDLPVAETDFSVLQSVVNETPVTPELNIVSEEVSSNTQPPVPAAVVVTTMEMLAPLSSNSPTENKVLAISADLAELNSSLSALNNFSLHSTKTALAQSVPLATTSKQQAYATKTSLLSKMIIPKIEDVAHIFKN